MLPKAVPLRCSTKLCPKLCSKAVARNLRFCKPVYQHVSPKPFCTAAPDSCAPKLLSLPRQLFPKAASKSCFLMPLPKAVVLQSNSPSSFCNAAALLPTVSCSPSSESCSPKHLCKAVAPKRLPKASPQSCPQ